MESSMTERERAISAAMATSPYLNLRQAVRPPILAHWLLAGDQERAGKLAAECEDLLFLTRELLTAAGRVRILAGPVPSVEISDLPDLPDLPESGGDRRAQFLDAYAEAGLLWAKVVGCSVALAEALIDRGEWDDVRRLADFLAGAGEDSAATDLRIQLGKAVFETHREQLRGISNTMPPAAISAAINTLAGGAARCSRGVPRPEQGGQSLSGAARLGHPRHHE
jgi:hypothetical protein